MPKVRIGRVYAYLENRRNVLVGEPARHQLQKLQFARSQLRERLRAVAGRFRGVCPQKFLPANNSLELLSRENDYEIMEVLD